MHFWEIYVFLVITGQAGSEGFSTLSVQLLGRICILGSLAALGMLWE